MATYTSDLTSRVLTACDAVTGWSELPAPHSSGGAPAADTENYFHNAASVSQSSGQAANQAAGMQYDNGAAVSWTAASNWCFFAWTFYAAPTNLKDWATGGMRIGIGSADNNANMFNAGGNDFGTYPYGGWQNTAFDPEATADQTIGSPGAGYRNFAVLPNVTAKITKGSPIAADVIRYGRGELKAIGADATFTGMATFNDNATTGRYGLFALQSGSYLWKGLMSLGDASNSVTFSDSNKLVRVEDTPRVLAGFNKIEINHASSSVTWTSITINGVDTSITGSAPVSPGDFEVVDNATLDFTACTFQDMGTFVFNGGANPNDLTTCTFRRCKQITQSGATFDGCLISNCEDAISLVVDDISKVTGNTFESDGSNHAVDLGSYTTGTVGVPVTTGITWDNVATGYDSAVAASPFTPTNTGNEVITVNVGQYDTLNINVAAGATVPSIRNTAGTAGTINLIAGQVTLTLTGLKANSEVRIYTANTTTELDGVENSGTSFGFSYTYAASTFVDIVIHHVDYEYIRIDDVLLGAGDASLPIQQQSDRWYSNP